MAEKRQPPLWLDMGFAEALERFAGTDPAEAKEAEAATVGKKRAAPVPKPEPPPRRAKRPKAT